MKRVICCGLCLLIAACAEDQNFETTGDNAKDAAGGAQPLTDGDRCVSAFTATLTQTVLLCEISDGDPPSSEVVTELPHTEAEPIGPEDVPSKVATEIPVDPPAGCGYRAGPWPVELKQTRECNGAIVVEMRALIGDELNEWVWGGGLSEKPDSVPEWNDLDEVGFSCSPCGTEPPPIDGGDGGITPVNQ